MNCPLCGHRFDETALSCQVACPMAAVQGCHLVCCPNCGYQMVDERKSRAVQLLRRMLSVAARDRSAPEAEDE
jgi:hypothetical protein